MMIWLQKSCQQEIWLVGALICLSDLSIVMIDSFGSLTRPHIPFQGLLLKSGSALCPLCVCFGSTWGLLGVGSGSTLADLKQTLSNTEGRPGLWLGSAYCLIGLSVYVYVLKKYNPSSLSSVMWFLPSFLWLSRWRAHGNTQLRLTNSPCLIWCSPPAKHIHPYKSNKCQISITS